MIEGKHSSRKGFTLIETLVAITILVAALAGPLVLTAQSLFASFVARDQMIASFLAQDAMEYIRHRRDNNILAGNDIFQGLESCIDSNNPDGCKVETLLGNVTACGSPCAALRYDETEGSYGYDANDSPTIFRRSVLISSLTGTEEYRVTVTVEWQTRSLNRQFQVEEVMYKWVDVN